MTQNIIIRPMQDADIEQAQSLIGALQEFLKTFRPTRLPWHEMKQDYWAWIISSVREKDGFIFLAEDNKVLKGIAVGWVEESVNRAYRPSVSKYGLVQDLFVDAAARGRGIGKMLMDASVEFFTQRKIGAVQLRVLPANPAARFYKDYGMDERLLTFEMLIEGAR